MGFWGYRFEARQGNQPPFSECHLKGIDSIDSEIMFDHRSGNYSLSGLPRCMQCLVKTPSRSGGSYLGTASTASSPSVKLS